MWTTSIFSFSHFLAIQYLWCNLILRADSSLSFFSLSLFLSFWHFDILQLCHSLSYGSIPVAHKLTISLLAHKKKSRPSTILFYYLFSLFYIFYSIFCFLSPLSSIHSHARDYQNPLTFTSHTHSIEIYCIDMPLLCSPFTIFSFNAINLLLNNFFINNHMHAKNICCIK